MTYSSEGRQVSKSMGLTSLRWSGTPSLNSYMTFAIDDELPSAFITSLTQTDTEINLPAGHYFVQAYTDYTRTNDNQTFQFAWYVDGTLTGHYGASDYYHSNSCDVAEASFTLDSAGALRLRITGQHNSASTLNDPHCTCYIWRVEK